MGSIYDLPTWSIVGCILLLTFIANEIGFRFGWQDRARESDGSRAVSNGLKASILGLAALLLGFSFSTTSTKHYQRQRLVLDEANAIGTCYLRTDLLEAPHRLEMQQGLKRFTEQRLRFFEFGLDPAVSTETLQEMDRELDQLWQICSAATREQSERMLVSQIIPSLNEVIDLNATRTWSTRNHMPQAVLILLTVCILVSSVITGHSSGQVGKRYLWLWIAFNLLLTLVLFVILDFDRPRRGLIQVDHQPLVELYESMETEM